MVLLVVAAAQLGIGTTLILDGWWRRERQADPAEATVAFPVPFAGRRRPRLGGPRNVRGRSGDGVGFRRSRPPEARTQATPAKQGFGGVRWTT
jgi:hypothetical protein